MGAKGSEWACCLIQKVYITYNTFEKKKRKRRRQEGYSGLDGLTNNEQVNN